MLKRCIIMVFSFVSTLAMDIVQLPQSSYEDVVQQFFSSVTYHKYEQTEKLLRSYPTLINSTTTVTKNCFHENMSSLHEASRVGNLYAMNLFIARKPLLMKACTNQGKTPLHMVANALVAELLLKNGAQADAKDVNGKTPLYFFLCNELMRSYSIAECLVQNGANVNQIYSEHFGETLLHYAAEKNVTQGVMEFLLKKGANPDIKDQKGKTPFDKTMEYGSKVKCFEKVGIYVLHIKQPLEDPIELLKQGARYFKQLVHKELGNNEKKIAETTLARLFFICKKNEKRSFNNSVYGKAEKIEVRNDDYPLRYVFRGITFADLEELIDKEGVNYARNYFDGVTKAAVERVDKQWSLSSIIKIYPFVFYYDTGMAFILINHMITQGNNFIKLQAKVDVTGLDSKGNTLLHKAIFSENECAIEWLFVKKIDCLIKNKENKTAADYIKECKNDRCKYTFIDHYASRFISRSAYEYQKGVLDCPLLYDPLFWHPYFRHSSMRTLFLQMLYHRKIKACSLLLTKGAPLNSKDRIGVSPLAFLIDLCEDKEWEDIPHENQYLIRLLLEHNAVVEQKIIEQVNGNYFKNLLQQVYEKQKCSMCCKHPAFLSHFSCVNRHKDLVCKACYDTVQKGDNRCPLCNNILYDFY